MKMAKAIVMASMMLALASRINAQDIFNAIHNGDVAKVEEFVEKNPQKDPDVKTCTPGGKTAHHLATERSPSRPTGMKCIGAHTQKV